MYDLWNQPPIERVTVHRSTEFNIPAPRFNGSDYDPELDDRRLTGQVLRVFELMKDGVWRSLEQIAAGTGDPQASISAQLRHLRKQRFGGHTVNKTRAGDRHHGLFVYQLVIKQNL